MNLRRIDCKRRTSILILAWSTILNIILISKFIVSPYQMEAIISTTALKKPLFRKILNLYTRFIAPFFSICNVCSFFFKGPKIIEQLDYYHMVYNANKLKIFIYLIISSNYVLLFIIFTNDGTSTLSNPFAKIWETYVFYLFCSQDYLVWGIVAYYKYGTYHLLCDLHQNLISATSLISEDVLYETIQTLAHHNQKLNNLVSIFVFYFFIVNGTFLIITVTVFLLDKERIFQLDYTMYLMLLFGSFAFAIHFSMKADQMCTTINSVTLKRFHWNTKNGFENVQSKNQKQSNRILLQNCLYQKYFQLNLFDCATLDYNFILKFALFVCSYVLIIIQTN